MSNETTSRRRLGPRDDYAVVPVCCTGRGGHRLHRFGKARVYPDGRRWQLDGVAGTSTGVANDVGIAFGQAGELRRIEPRIHAGQDGELTPWRHR